MTRRLTIHPHNPQRRLLEQAAAVLSAGGVVAYPTDSGYALGCLAGADTARLRIRQLRDLPPDHLPSIVCRDLSEVANYARVDNPRYRLLKRLTPGPYTFILPAARTAPRRLQDPKRRTVGLRVPDCPLLLALLEGLDEPLLSSSLILPDDPAPLNDAAEIEHRLARKIDLIIDGGPTGALPTSILDLQNMPPVVLRTGAGAVDEFAAAA